MKLAIQKTLILQIALFLGLGLYGQTPTAATRLSTLKLADTTLCNSAKQDDETRIFRECSGVGNKLNPKAGAIQFFQRQGAKLGINTQNLTFIETKHGLASTHVRFQQTLQGLPIHDGQILVQQNKQGTIRKIVSRYLNNPEYNPDTQAAITRDQAETAAFVSIRKSIGVQAKRRLPSKIELVWYRTGKRQLKLAWKLNVFVNVPVADYLILVDARSAAILNFEDRTTRINGSGMVYQPNPVQTLGNWSSIADNNDATNTTLNGERASVTLQGLNAGTNLLIGEFVDMSLAGGLNVPDANEVTRVYNYTRDDDRFEQVVIYHSIDTLQRYFHSLGFDDHSGTPNGIRDFPTKAHAHWDTADQSFYSTGDDAVHFGDGGVDDGEDADIIAHEYGHAVQHNQNSSWGGGEMGAMGEGFGDYLAASFYATSGNASYQTSHVACVGEWDATAYSSTNPPCLRRVDGSKHYPESLVGQVHADGEIWSSALWDLRTVLGAIMTDTLVLEHHFGLPANATMETAALEIIDVDTNMNGGANLAAIRTAFCDRGILTGTDCVITMVVPNPTWLFPGGGENLITGAASNLAWNKNSAAAGTSYQIDINNSCTPNVILSDGFESGTPLWSLMHGLGAADWALSVANPNTGSQSIFSADLASISDQYLQTLSAIIPSSGDTLSFWHHYQTESTYDGGVVEISTDGTTWTDLEAFISQNTYNATIDTGFSSPIAGRMAFSGDSGGYIQTLIDLSSFAGQSVFIRFRMTSDSSVAATGWHIDDVAITSSTGAWTSIGTSPVDASTLAWAQPLLESNDYCVRITGSAAGFSDSATIQSGIFSVFNDTDGDLTPNNIDTDDDNDGLSDVLEGTLGTDPLDADTDNDGFDDGVEVSAGSDPNDPGSVPVNADGDVDGNGIVNVADVLLAVRILNGEIVALPGSSQFIHADVAPLVAGVPTPDGVITLGDIVVIQRKALGKINF